MKSVNFKSSRSTARPRVGVVGLAYPGYHLGEELGPGKLREMLARLKTSPVDAVAASRFVRDEAAARAIGRELAAADVDCLLTVMTTFVPDHFIVALLEACDRPIFLWAVERELQCISVVCGPLITATLHNLEKPGRLVGADLDDPAAFGSFLTFARAALAKRLLRALRVGYCGGRCPIMLSMAVDEYTLKRQFGTTVVTLPIEELQDLARQVKEPDVKRTWTQIKAAVGTVTAKDADGRSSARWYLAARALAERHGLDALSLNCFPHLKSQICLGVARLNDGGIAAACEGDLHSTILMHVLSRLGGRPAFNGDWLRMDPEQNTVLFSHCGAGAFSLAASPRSVGLRCSIETCDGLAVCYATEMRGPVTLVNLMYGPQGLRVAAMQGEGVPTDTEYEGTPLRVKFARPVQDLLQEIARTGAGHHWNGAPGNLLREFALLGEFCGVRFNPLTEVQPA